MFSQVKNIFFDFDGVILDSVDCKTQAFEKMYSKYGNDIAKKVKKYHLDNGGVSRFEKFRFWHKEYLGISLNEDDVNEMAKEFSKLVFHKVIESKEIPGVMHFIKSNYKKLKFWIITGTPTNEILKIVNHLQLDDYFLASYGSPEKKIFWTEKIISKQNLDRRQTLFIGDASTDYEAAKYSSLKFALRKADYNIDFFKNKDVFKFNHFDELSKQLNL